MLEGLKLTVICASLMADKTRSAHFVKYPWNYEKEGLELGAFYEKCPGLCSTVGYPREIEGQMSNSETHYERRHGTVC